MTDETVYITVGKIGSTYGIKGWLKIHSYTEFGAGILEYKPWFLSKDETSWEKVEIEDGKMHGNIVIAKFNGYDNPEDARILTGNVIAVERSQLPILAKNEFYWSELIGLTVIDHHGENLGQVAFIMETGSNDVLVVKGAKEHAIPYLPGSVILKVDLEKKEIHVNWEII